jgi:branched-chain amino acid transport system substrate-binding protein
MTGFQVIRNVVAACAIVASVALPNNAQAADPIKLGFSMALTGGIAVNGKQCLLALLIWRDDINAKGGLLGRPVELVYYDDQSNPSNVPGIYTKLIDVDKVDLVVGPYATNMVAPAMPVIIQHNMTDVSIQALDVNSEFRYARYFATLPVGQQPKLAFAEGFFEIAKQQTPKPKTVAIVAADAEFSRNSSDGARLAIKNSDFQIVYDKSYPPTTTDYAPIVRAIQATNPDLVFAAAYPPDTIGLIRAMNEIGFKPKMFGGTLIGLLATAPKASLGPMINGIITQESFMNSPKLDFPGLKEMMTKYQAAAPAQGVDPLGYGYAPAAYSAAQILAVAVEGTKSLDHTKIADYIHTHTIPTVLGDLKFGENGEWAQSRIVYTQFQNVVGGNNIEQFRDPAKEAILWPPAYKTGDVIYPFADAQK